MKIENQGAAVAIHSPETDALQLLCTSNRRLYELNLNDQSDSAKNVTTWFLQANPPSASQPPDHLWSLYGCHGYAPREARVSSLLLQPGRVEILLSSRGTRIALGAFSLADRLLNEASLLSWAKSLHKEARAAGQWQADGNQVSFRGTQQRKFRREIHHDLHFRHDPRNNRIAWQHRQRWGGAVAPSRSLAGIADPN
jgi:hypothetical protein